MMYGDHSFNWKNTCANIVAFSRSIKLAVTSPQWQTSFKGVNVDGLLNLLQMQLESGPQSNLWSRRRREADILEFAYSIRDKQSSDIRDRIYALVGLAAKTTDTRIVPSYKKPTETAFEDFAGIVSKQTANMCTELTLTELNTKRNGVPTSMMVPTAASEGTDLPLDTLIERSCAQAIEDVRNHAPRRAARLLESMATLLRAESYKIE